MHFIRGGAAAGLAGVVVFSAGPALADSNVRTTPQQLLLFSGTDLWRNGGFAHAGALWSPSGLDHQGLVFKVAFGSGLYRYVSGGLGNVEVAGHKTDAVAMAGWRFRGQNLYLTVFAGLDWQRHKLLPNDPGAGLRGDHLGFRGAIEVWYQPTAATMVQADISVTTVGPSYSARLAYGWRLFDKFYAGPELSAFTADDNYRQYRAGVHITSLSFATFSRPSLRWLNFEWSAGVGYAIDSDDRRSFYGRVGLLTRR